MTEAAGGAGVSDSVGLLRRLIGFDTTSRNSNLALIEFLRDRLADHGVDSTLYRDAGGGKDKGPSYGAQVTYRLGYPARGPTRQEARPDSSARSPR